MSENIFWTTLAQKSKSTKLTKAKEIAFLCSQIKKDCTNDDIAFALRKSLGKDILSDKTGRTESIRLLDKPSQERLSQITNISITSLLDEAYELTRAELTALGEAVAVNQADYEKEEPEDTKKQEYPRKVRASYGLFKHQRKVSERIIESLQDGAKGCIIHMPTGSGKTRTAMWTICNLISNHHKRCGWLTYSRILSNQAIDEFRKAWSRLGDRECNINYLLANQSQAITTDKHHDMTFCSFGKLSIDVTSDERELINLLSNQVDVLFIDEAHEAQAIGRAAALRAIRFRNSSIQFVGLTATPGKSRDGYNEEDRLLTDIFDGRKITLEIDDYKNPLDYLTEEGYLARANFSELEKTWNNDILDETLQNLALIKQCTEKHSRAIVFCKSVSESKRLCALVELTKQKAYHVDANTPEPERDQIFDEFNREDNQSKIIFNFNVLATGFDAPKISAVLILRPISSIVLLSQIIGRGLRGTKAGGTDKAEIHLLMDKGEPESLDTAKLFLNWDHLWRESK